MNFIFIPIIALGILIILLPYYTFGVYPKTTTLYVYLGVMAFFSLLRLKDSWFFKTNKSFDKVVTILIWLISLPVFLVFGLMGIIIIFCYPESVHKVSYFLGVLVIFVFGIKLEVIGNPPKEQSIVIYNHCSTIDDVLNPIIMGTRRWKVVFAPEILRIPFVKFITRYIGIPLVRTDSDSREEVKEITKTVLENGDSLLILPEGKRLPADRKEDLFILPFNKGAFRLSQITGIPVVPVVVSWTYLFKPRSGQWWFSPRTIKIKYLSPVLINPEETPGDFGKRVRLLMEKELIELINSKK